VEYVIKGRNMKLDDSIKDYADKKIKKKIGKFLDRGIKVEVELAFEKNPSINLNNLIEVTIFTPGAVIRATDSGTDAFEAVDKVSGKLERRVKKYRDKLRHREKKSAGIKSKAAVAEDEEIAKKIVKTKTFTIIPMSIEEAILQMELLGHDFFVFLNSETNRTAVIYCRRDGNYGLIEPTV
jgi:putative sigma-54 modulation protein